MVSRAVGNELKSDFLLGRVQNENVGQSHGVEHTQDIEDVMAQISDLASHRQERKNGMLRVRSKVKRSP